MKITRKILLKCGHCGWVYDPERHDGNYCTVPGHYVRGVGADGRGGAGKLEPCAGEFTRPRSEKDMRSLTEPESAE